MVKPEKGMARPEKYSTDAEHDKRGRWEGATRGKIFYKQPANRDRRGGPRGKRALDGRELSLAFGCDLPGGWEPYAGKTGIIPSKYHEEVIIKHLKNDRGG